MIFYYFDLMYKQQTINCRGHLLDLSSPVVMGILNVTPDSFYEQSRVTQAGALQKVEQFLEEGVRIIDIGGMSSRPGAEVVSSTEELNRVIPVIEQIKRRFPDACLSIDTVHSQVARLGIEAGASIVNDISAGSIDPQIHHVVAAFGNVPYILMHMQGVPRTMQDHPEYTDIALEVLDFLIEKLGFLRSLGMKDIIVDPGFGFGKTIDQNYILLKKLSAFSIMEVPILVGLSRKSMIYKLLGISPQAALSATSALHWKALDAGASILRVHDVKAAVDVIQLWTKIREI